MFVKDYSLDVFNNNDISYVLKEVFYTYSKKGVLRALHFQETIQQPKLVRCIHGRIYDVIVDLRPDSKTFKQSLGFYLSKDNLKQLLIPAGFGHGYLVLEDSIVSYKCSERFYAEYDTGIIYNDKELNIVWPFEELNGDNIILSERDLALKTFDEYFRSYKKL
jgi:dTDP-4-dehydrorhamnose 3,5-epimerase